MSNKDVETLALESVSQHEVDYFREKMLSQRGQSENDFLKVYRMQSLKHYIAHDKLATILHSIEFADPLFQPFATMVIKALLKIPYYVLDELIDDTVIKIIATSECYAVNLETEDMKDLVSEGKYENAYQLAVKPQWLILLYKPQFEIDEEHSLFIVAHELAHRYLKHNPKISKHKSTDMWDDEADALAEKWGFKKPENWKIS